LSTSGSQRHCLWRPWRWRRRWWWYISSGSSNPTRVGLRSALLGRPCPATTLANLNVAPTLVCNRQAHAQQRASTAVGMCSKFSCCRDYHARVPVPHIRRTQRLVWMARLLAGDSVFEDTFQWARTHFATLSSTHHCQVLHRWTAQHVDSQSAAVLIGLPIGVTVCWTSPKHSWAASKDQNNNGLATKGGVRNGDTETKISHKIN
jgi:hypothetical protein